MIIGIDGNEANIKNRVGVNKYAYEIINAIYNLLPDNPDLIVYIYLKDKPCDDMSKETSNFKYKILPGGKVWIMTKLWPYLLSAKEKPDVFFTPSHYLPPFVTVPTVCSIMDLGYLESSAQFTKYDFWQLKYWTAWSLKRSKYILTISNATKEDIVRQYPSTKNKIVVTHPGYDNYLTTHSISDTSINDVRKKYHIVNDYMIYIGTLKPSKNIEGLIDAFAKINNSNLQLVIAGKKGWLYETIFEKVKNLKLQDRIIFTDFVEEKEKLALIKGAKVFVMPSFWEGFGLDILTAFALGTPVVASNVGSIPEVVGDAGILIDPYNIDSIKKGIEKVLLMPKINYNILIAKEKARLKKFSWEKAAKITLDTLKKAIE